MSAGHGDHTDLWNYIEGLREDLGHAEQRIRDLEEKLATVADDAIRAHLDNAPHIYADGSTS